MKRQPTVLLAIFVVTLGLLLGTSAAQATEVILDGDGNVTQILNLPVTNKEITTVYDVEFIYATSEEVYGPDLEFDFPPPGELILVALRAVNNALNNNDPTPVGAGPQGTIDYFIGHVEQLNIVAAAGGELIEGVWERCQGEQCLSLGDINTGFAIVGPNETVTFAGFTEVTGPPPDPVTIGGTVSGLEGSGLVLQNNESDDEPIAADGEFTFDTPLTPGTPYNVSVKTQPSNPAQTCSVENGSGLAPIEDVTSVAVTCAEPVLGDLVKVAAEGDTLPDSTVLTNILLDAGVAINLDGQVAFGGRDDDGTDAVFTQAGKVVAEGDSLDDGTILAAFRGQGQVAINSGQLGDRVAFHGHAESGLVDTAAVFTQAGKVAAVGDTLSTGITVDDIDPDGKVAINNFDQLAFHGQIEIAGGLQKRRVVFIADGEETREAAQEATNLPDGTPLDDITESGGVAINDFDEVAFHGQTVDPDAGGDMLKAVFTTDGLAAREGATLPDGATLDDINENGGVAINLFGDVAFHGSVIVPDAGSDAVKAVLTGAGVIAKEGDILPDGTTVDEIEVNGGVAINVFGEVAFHGRTGGVQAVFISDGQTIQVVAKVGDNVNDGTTLSEINDTAGVTIKSYGFEVAFHGRIGTTDAVFVGLASPPTPNIPPEADFSFTTDDLTANFTDESTDSDGEVVAWSWNFGDNNTSTEQNPSHPYAAAGTYTVTLTVTDDDGDESVPAEDSVEVSAPPSGDVVQVFVTNYTYLGDLGGLAGGDAKCQELAEDAGLTGTWTAWLSTSGSGSDVDAPDRIPDGRYELLDGTVIADNKDDLTDGELNAPINLDPFGNPISDGFAWTGTSLLGRSTGTNCSNWTNQTGGRCTEGAPGCGDNGDITDPLLWTSGFRTACDNALHLYCFSSGE